MAANDAILARLVEIDEALRDLYEKQLVLPEPPETPAPKRTLGFKRETN